MSKIFVDVILMQTKDGQKLPLKIRFESGISYKVDRVTDIRRAASLKAGGQGMRYRCSIQGKETYLWLEEDKWFMEGR